MNLSQLKQGESGIVIGNTHVSAMKRRLQDIGILSGTVVTCVSISPLGNPVAYRIRNAVIALRVEDAQKIDIREVDYD